MANVTLIVTVGPIAFSYVIPILRIVGVIMFFLIVAIAIFSVITIAAIVSILHIALNCRRPIMLEGMARLNETAFSRNVRRVQDIHVTYGISLTPVA